MQLDSCQARPGKRFTAGRTPGVLAGLVAAALALGCGSADLPAVCTAKGYYQGANIDLVDPSPGTAIPWQVEVTARGETVIVEMTGDSWEQAPRCGAGAANRDLGCGRSGARIEVAVTPRYGDQPAQVRVANVGALGGPDELTLRVSHGAASATRTLRPRYTTTEPNGPGCGDAINSKDTVELAPSAP